MCNTKYLSIKNGILVRCDVQAEGQIVIPNDVKIIGWEAFKDCIHITSIKIPNTVTVIGAYAFFDCYRLTNIEIPNSVTNIWTCAFAFCMNLKSIKIPNSVTTIGKGAFAYCYRLENINIPNSGPNIGDKLFAYCESLKCNKIDKNQKKILAYKGLNEDFTCRGFQYEIGKTYHEDKAITCECGFHACLNPLDVLVYYPNENNNRFALVELSGYIDFKEVENMTKLAATNIKIIKELTFNDLISEFNRLNE